MRLSDRGRSSWSTRPPFKPRGDAPRSARRGLHSRFNEHAAASVHWRTQCEGAAVRDAGLEITRVASWPDALRDLAGTTERNRALTDLGGGSLLAIGYPRQIAQLTRNPQIGARRPHRSAAWDAAKVTAVVKGETAASPPRALAGRQAKRGPGRLPAARPPCGCRGQRHPLTDRTQRSTSARRWTAAPRGPHLAKARPPTGSAKGGRRVNPASSQHLLVPCCAGRHVEM